MEHYIFRKHKCILSRNGFDLLSDGVLKTCGEALVFYKCDGVFVFGGVEAFCEFRDNIYERNDRNLVMLRRHVFNSIAHFESVENFVYILWDLINRYEKKYVEAKAIEVEMRPYNMIFYGAETENQFVEIKILDDNQQND